MYLGFILRDIIEAGGRAYYVGGYVRDYILGIPSKDVDIEVFGVNLSTLRGIIERYVPVDLVGQSFGILKARIGGEDVDFSLPRRDSKNGVGHKGFDIEVDPTMTIEEAAARRDFTINAISMDCVTGELIDPFGGRSDLMNNEKLAHINDSFADDPLRVLRGMQFCARFNLEGQLTTLRLCHSLFDEYKHLPKERVWGEWEKWAMKSVSSSLGLQFLWECGWIHHWPELANMMGIVQDATHHPEIFLLTHVVYVVDEARNIAVRDNLSKEDRLILMFAALCHDMGKPATTKLENGRITSKGHAEVGVPLAESFLTSIGAPLYVIEGVKPLVAEHLVHTQKGHTPRSVRRLMVRLNGVSIDQLLRLIEADHSGRPPLPGGLPKEALKLKELAAPIEVTNNRPTQILFGRHLIEAGLFVPGPELGKAVKTAYEAQLDGEFDSVEGGIEWYQLNKEK